MNALLTLAAIKAITKLTAGKCTSNKCLAGKTAIVTGCTTGIGYEATKQLASHGCKIYFNGLLNLNEDIMGLLRYAFNNQELYYHKVNLTSYDSVRTFCDYFKEHEQKLDILIHNAERMGQPRAVSSDNVLAVMQVNHLSPFLMTHLLQDQLKAAPGSRIVYVSNIIAYVGTLWRPYGLSNVTKVDHKLADLIDFTNSKCCQMIAASILAKRLKPYNITCNVAYPGWTDIEDRKVHNNVEAGNWTYDTIKVLLDAWIYLYGKTRLEGAQMTLHAAMAQELNNTTGRFIMDNRAFPLPYYTYRREFCDTIWELSETLCKLRPEEKLV